MQLTREARTALADEVKEALERGSRLAFEPITYEDLDGSVEVVGLTVTPEGHTIIERAIERAWARQHGGRFAHTLATA